MSEEILEKLTPKQIECVKKIWNRSQKTSQKTALLVIAMNLLSFIIIVGLTLPIVLPNKFGWQDQLESVAFVCLYVSIIFQIITLWFLCFSQLYMYLFSMDYYDSENPEKRKKSIEAENLFLSRPMLVMRVSNWKLRTYIVPTAITLALVLNQYIAGAVIYFCLMVGIITIMRLVTKSFITAVLGDIEKRGITAEFGED